MSLSQETTYFRPIRPVFGVLITKDAPVDMEMIESALNNYTIGSLILEKHSHTALIELYANGKEIPVYYMTINNRYQINALIGSADRLIIFRRNAEEFKYVERAAIKDKVVVDVKMV